MESLEETKQNPLKRSFDSLSSPPQPDSEAMDTDITFIPRDYQLKMYEMAMKRNTIAVLETGGGKTMIAVMLIKEIGKSLKIIDGRGKKLIVFLAPTVHLVHQQYKEIKSHTELDVDEYYGAKGIDDWNEKIWEKEINERDVLVMTPQILLDALRKGYLNFEVISFIVLDECHRASGSHPYARIMKEFYHKSTSRPKIFGMTASPIIRKGVSSTKESKEQFEELESLLDSQIYIVEDRIKLEEYIPSAKQICRFYDPVQIPNGEIKAKLECSWSKFDAVLLGFQNSLSSGYKDTDDKFKSLRNRLANDHTKILFSLENLGLLCAYEAVKVCIEMTPEVREECEVYKESVVQYKNFLQEVLSTIEGSEEHKKLLNVVNSGEEAMTTGQISPKLHELLEIFRSFGNDKEVLCIIFVERIMTAKVIERVMCKITDLSHFNVSYLTGSNSSTGGLSPEAQKKVLESFRAGKVNLLFSTDVVEEGIDVAKCSCVIRFDLTKTVRSYIQSRGRARHKDSEYIIMLERGNTKQLDDMFYITRSENSMTQTAMNRNPDDCSIKACITKEEHVYVVGSTGASVTADSSVSLIHRYCQKLPGDKYFTPKPKFVDLEDGDLFRCRLILPPNAPFQTNIGPLAQNRHIAKQLVCLDACKKLHEMGALSDNLLPICDESSKKNTCDSKSLTSGAGTTKRKELHGSIKIRLLSGSLGDKLDSTSFHAYKMDFSCNIAEQKYSSFVLLLDAKLADDVGNIEVELYLLTKFVKASVSFCDQICLDSNQIARAKCFQELIFNGLFGKLFVKSSGVRKFLLQTEESLWAPSNMYLLLPLESEDIPLKINWTGIESCVSAVEFLRTNALLNFQKPEITDGNSSPVASDPPIATKFSDDNNVIHLANISASVDSLKEMVVVAIHTGRIYSILDSVANTSSESPFEGDSDTNYSSFADYYLKKYCIVLKHPEQPLLLLKQGHNSHNLLVDFRNEGVPLENKSGGKKEVVEKPQQHAHMPPELLVGININTEILKSFYLLPSLMHRIESLMLASQLREEISRHGCNFNISSSLILEALTTLRCNESFSMERLELLGDSVLKYAVSCHLFLKYPKKHEGQLSSIRSNIVCNSALHKLGTNRRLQEYVRDCAFDPRRWAAPGQRTIWPSPCDHGLEMTEVPLDDIKYYGEDKKLMLGKACDLGHRWMLSKTISDCVESLIGAYYVGGGLNAALSLMKWLGVEAEIEHCLIDEAIKVASLYCYAPKVDEIGVIESKIGYKFCTKGLLLEAITHGTGPEQGVGYCYQRLEFLGDAVLDVLITLHLYENHRNVDPGELTDLRSASVNNDSFALAAVRWNLHPHLLHGSLHLDNQISAFVKIVSGMTSTASLAPEIKAPKALGDLVESITGAVFIDSKLDLEQVWKVMKPILSPIVTPDKLELQPSRELIELCDSLGYFIKENFSAKGDLVQVELKLQLEDVLLNGQGSGPTRKAARGMAALRILKQLEKRGITSSKRKKHETDDVDPTWSKDVETSESARKKQKVHELQQQQPGINRDLVSSESTEIPVVPPIEMKKGGPRQSLYELCKKLQWPMPSFETMEQKSRTPIQIGDATGFNSFESQICLTIPDFGKIELTGEARADKKSSFDSAALVMLHELMRRGKIVIGE